MIDAISLAIRQIRERKNLSTYDLSKKTGISQSTISKLENGNRSADIEILKSIAEGLGVTINEILEGPTTTQQFLIKELMKKGIRPEELSQNISVTYETINDTLLNNRKNIDVLYKIAEYLGYTENFIDKSLSKDYSFVSITEDYYESMKYMIDFWENLNKTLIYKSVDTASTTTLAAHMDNENDYIGGLTPEEKDALEAYLTIYRLQQKQKKGE